MNIENEKFRVRFKVFGYRLSNKLTIIRELLFINSLNPQKSYYRKKVINNSSQNIVHKYFTQCLAAKKIHLF